MIKLNFYRGTGFTAWLVRTASRKPWAHVEIVIHGVAFVLHAGTKCVQRYEVTRPKPEATVSIPHVDGAWERAVEAVGSPYDYLGAIRSGTPFGREHPKKWFCSELAAHALNLKDAHTRSPGDLAEAFLPAKK